MKRINNKKGEFDFAKYFVFMFIAIALVGVFGSLTYNLTANYNVSNSQEFETYLNAFSADTYADETILNVDSSDAGNDFAEYEASFKFGEQVKETKNETEAFVKASTEILGLSSQTWVIISSIIFILMLVAIVYFLRGIK